MRARFHTVLVANRGEIAVRILRACRDLGLSTVAVYTLVDEHALHIRCADIAYLVPDYLDANAILQIAAESGAEAVHPGYGFLSENPDFAAAVHAQGLIWIGPSADAIARMGNKREACYWAAQCGVPVIPGKHEKGLNAQQWQDAAIELGFPLLIKAAAGGGGRGLRPVYHLADFASALQSAQTEARQAFGNDQIYLERYLPHLRHIEFQILGDEHGNMVELGERDCSVQRRYQKVIEESPAPLLPVELRAQMAQAALTLARALNYVGAGTLEFVVSPENTFYFLEMNTRLQVEHPVSEVVRNIDLVQWQLRIAQGEVLCLDAQQETSQGHAIECRICAERDFNPTTGQALLWQPPSMPWARCDSGIQSQQHIGIHYDSLLAKLIVWAPTRVQALQRMQLALSQTVLLGVHSNINVLRHLLKDKELQQGGVSTQWLGKWQAPQEESLEAYLVIAYLLWQNQQQIRPWPELPSGWRNGPRPFLTLYFQGEALRYRFNQQHSGTAEWRTKRYDFECFEWNESQFRCVIGGIHRSYTYAADPIEKGLLWLHTSTLGIHTLQADPLFPTQDTQFNQNVYRAQVPAQVLSIEVEKGQTVQHGTPLLTLVSMKVETTLTANAAGTVQALWVTPGQEIAAGTLLLEITPCDES